MLKLGGNSWGEKKILQAVIVLRMFVSSLEQVKSYLGSAAPVSVLICDALCISFFFIVKGAADNSIKTPVRDQRKDKI